MKKIGTLLLVVAVVLTTMPACKKDIADRTANLPALSTDNLDLTAGNWKPVLLSRADTFPVVAPAATNTPAYAADLNEIKGYQRTVTSEEKDIIKYWAAGGVLRWNEIMRKLVAKYNLPPYQNADGSYPIPNSANPFAYPQFPFSNPPYAGRAYAYVSAAQYDALVACWFYKTKYNRAAPWKVDSSVQAINIAKTDLPSYPSEAAVLAGVTAELMKLLFPTEVGYVQQKLEEAELAAITSGAATRSDINAGEALGRQVAQQFVARGRTDNAGKAVGTPADWSALETNTAAKGEIPWISLEVPKRNPMLPFFGNVKSFSFDSMTCVSLRPGPPPSTNSDQMKQETEQVYNYIKNPSRDQIRTVQFWADGAGSYTPPGHWDAIAVDDFIKKNYSEVRWARNMALLNIALMDAGIVCWNTKYFYFNPRPTQMNSSIKTLTGIPNFPAYISGHSTFSGAAAAVLGYILPENADKYNAMASEASLSRVIGGIHYPSDCSVGLEVGKNVGSYSILRGEADGSNN